MAVNKAVFQEEQGQACFVFPGRPEPLERELEKGSPEWAKAAGQEVLNCCKTTPPICTRISKHKTPGKGIQNESSC